MCAIQTWDAQTVIRSSEMTRPHPSVHTPRSKTYLMPVVVIKRQRELERNDNTMDAPKKTRSARWKVAP